MKTKIDKPTFNRTRPLSWSAISSFEYDPAQWYRRYVLGEKDRETPEMRFGKQLGERLAFDLTFLPTVPRHPIFEHRLFTGLQTKEFGLIPLIGYVDSMAKNHQSLLEYKTGKKAWTQKRVDGHGQLDMYLMMIYLIEKLKPEDITTRLVWLPTEESLQSMDDDESTISLIEPCVPQVFITKRSMAGLLRFGHRLVETYRAMIDYAEAYQLSPEEEAGIMAREAVN